MIIYTKNTGASAVSTSKLETPIKMIIQHESDLITRKGGICDSLFNIEKSNRFGETIVGGNEFSLFAATEEGMAAEDNPITGGYEKFIEHIQFMKEFAISAEMMEDANYGIAADAKRRAENFTRAYYKTINKICETALAMGTSANATYANASLDLTAPDGLPLFHASHKWGTTGGTNGTQSNYFYGDIFCKGTDRAYSEAAFEEALYNLSVKLRNMKDESGESLGYSADTVVLPGNKPMAELIAKKVLGGECNHGDCCGVQFGEWKVVVLPGWQPTHDSVMVMSSEANKNLAGNMFFNRIPLTVTSWIDNHSGNYIWNGRCRFGVGFGNYKHILLAVDSASAVSGATKM